jgi:hypothetical protein
MTREKAELTVLCALGLVCLVLGVLQVRQRRIAARARERVRTLEGDIRVRDGELAYLVAERLPRLADSALVDRGPVPGARGSHLDGSAFAGSIEAVHALFADALARSRTYADHSVRDTLGGIVSQIQGVIGEQEVELRAMQDRHENPDLLADLLRLDHLNAQMMRRAQTVAVLCGRWTGRQRDASPLTDVVRGAISKISDYRRVEYAENDEIAVIAQAVEPVVLSVAELLENAARRSQPNAPVRVGIQSAYNGVAITIDDAGIGMDDRQMREAREILGGTAAIDITRLGDPPRIGFPAVAALARQYHFSAHLEGTSAYGGVRAVVFIPSALLTRPARPAPRTAAVGTSPANASGLPQRTRATRTAEATAHVAAAPVAAGSPAAASPDDVGARLGAFQTGTREGRRTEGPHSDSQDR